MRIVAGEWGGRRIAAPSGRDTRPTTDRVREAWMSTVASAIPGARVLDLFAGSGALGLEALSRGATSATFVESAASALRALRANLESLDAADRAVVVHTDALRYIAGLSPKAFDLAFADPPYGRGLAAGVAAAFHESPFAEILCVERRVSDPFPQIQGARERRYGDTVLTFLSAP
jgi:16S rRNA (guanine966-N2)-methyltransferase